MPQALIIPDGYGLVLLAAASATTVNVYHMFLTGNRRKKAGIPYPNAYATHEEAEKSVEKLAFNAAQRAHANYTENLTSFMVALAISGLTFPKVSAYLGFSWVVARFLYGWGYARPGLQYSKNGKGRMIGAWGSLPLVGLMGMSLYSAAQFVM